MLRSPLGAFTRRAGTVCRRLSDERGQTLAEYGLMLTLVAVGVVIPTMIIFRGALIDAYTSAMNCLNGSC
jgi:Flp pilus assembly pilin Flp